MKSLKSTVHSQTISELLQPGQTFRDLFIPEPPELSEDSTEDDEDWQQNSGQGNDPDRKVLSSINPPSSIFKNENGTLNSKQANKQREFKLRRFDGPLFNSIITDSANHQSQSVTGLGRSFGWMSCVRQMQR